MEKKPSKLPLILSILALAVAIAALVVALRPAPQQQPGQQPQVQAQGQPQQPTQPPQPGQQQPGQQPQQPGQEPQPETGAVQFILYLGTNDKDTNEPVCTAEEAKAKAIPILLKHFSGYTIQEANGGWVDDGKTYTEYTLVIYLSDTDLEHVHAASDELIKEFNQSSVLIHANQTKTEYYSGASK